MVSAEKKRRINTYDTVYIYSYKNNYIIIITEENFQKKIIRRDNLIYLSE